jgi:hypothetical protein
VETLLYGSECALRRRPSFVSIFHACHGPISRTSVRRGQSICVERRLRTLEAISAGSWCEFNIDLWWDHLLVVSHVNGSAILLDLGDVLDLTTIHVLLLPKLIVHAKHKGRLVEIRKLLRAQTRRYGWAMRWTKTCTWARAMVV